MIEREYIRLNSKCGMDIVNQLHTHTEGSEALVVLFPGYSYSCESPLLYYTRKAAMLSGCDTLSLEFSFLPDGSRMSDEDLRRITEESFTTIENAIRNRNYKTIVFISKSIGSLAAGEIGQRMGYKNVLQIFLTPLPESLPYIMKSDCMAVVGTKDKYMTGDFISALKKCPSVELKIIDGVGHSLENNDCCKESISLLQQVTGLCEGYIKKHA